MIEEKRVIIKEEFKFYNESLGSDVFVYKISETEVIVKVPLIDMDKIFTGKNSLEEAKEYAKFINLLLE